MVAREFNREIFVSIYDYFGFCVPGGTVRIFDSVANRGQYLWAFAVIYCVVCGVGETFVGGGCGGLVPWCDGVVLCCTCGRGD